MTGPLRDKLQPLRDALLALHKALVDSERATYEATVGAIQSPNHFLQLLTTDPWFAWLQALSQLIVYIDETLDEKKHPYSMADVDTILKQIRALLAPSETGNGFPRHYFDALQRDPNVVMAHSEVIKLLGPRKTK